MMHITPAICCTQLLANLTRAGHTNLLVELLLLRSVVLTSSSSQFSLEEVNSLVDNVACYYLFIQCLYSVYDFIINT